VGAGFSASDGSGLNEFVSLAQKTSALRCDEDTITDTMWMLAPDAYLRLVHDAAGPSNGSTLARRPPATPLPE
jgi:hypothetical protein